MQLSRLKLSFIIAFLYVLVGTGVAYLTAYDGTIDPTSAAVLDSLFFPAGVFLYVIILSEGITFSSMPYVQVSQGITFLVLWPVFYFAVKLFQRRTVQK